MVQRSSEGFAVRFVYPYTVTLDEHGFWQVRFPDVPQALTEGEGEEEAHALAPDALVAALGGLMKAKRDLPGPSDVVRDNPFVVIPMLQSAKIALYLAMREKGMSRVVLAREIGKQESEVRRMLDLDHETKIDTLEFALMKLGKQIETEVREAA